MTYGQGKERPKLRANAAPFIAKPSVMVREALISGATGDAGRAAVHAIGNARAYVANMLKRGMPTIHATADPRHHYRTITRVSGIYAAAATR